MQRDSESESGGGREDPQPGPQQQEQQQEQSSSSDNQQQGGAAASGGSRGSRPTDEDARTRACSFYLRTGTCAVRFWDANAAGTEGLTANESARPVTRAPSRSLLRAPPRL